MNTGKQFEADFKASIPSDAWCYRLKDSAATYYGGNENLSFSIDNICDFLVYRYPMNHLFELKTIETPYIPLEKIFGKYDKAKCKYRKEKHITDMVDAMGYSGQTAHVIVSITGRSTAPLQSLPARFWRFVTTKAARASLGSGQSKRG